VLGAHEPGILIQQAMAATMVRSIKLRASMRAMRNAKSVSASPPRYEADLSRGARVNRETHHHYEAKNTQTDESEHDPFAEDRYRQFCKYLPMDALRILDVGCNTGRGGITLKAIRPELTIAGLDCVQSKLDVLPNCYAERIYGLSTDIPAPDGAFDVVVAGEFLEHLYPSDVDRTLCEFQRVLKVGGHLLLTTPNPNYLKHLLLGSSVYRDYHLTQHYPKVLKNRLRMHGFSRVRVLGSGRASRYIGSYFPLLSAYGSYLVLAQKY
jgi:2-polyprenyl-3-methyl-5-hydroxy-6-metoxy-1,4-benzoquinol methylase